MQHESPITAHQLLAATGSTWCRSKSQISLNFTWQTIYSVFYSLTGASTVCFVCSHGVSFWSKPTVFMLLFLSSAHPLPPSRLILVLSGEPAFLHTVCSMTPREFSFDSSNRTASPACPNLQKCSDSFSFSSGVLCSELCWGWVNYFLGKLTASFWASLSSLDLGRIFCLL